MLQRMTANWAKILILILALLTIAATLIPLIVSNHWWIRLVTFPQAQIAMLLLILAGALPFAFDLGKLGPKLLLAALVAAIVYQLQYLLPYTPLWEKEARSAGGCAPERTLRVIVLNLRKGNDRYAPVVDLLQARRPDLFLALEADAGWVEALEPLEGFMPNSISVPRQDAWGMVLMSRYPLTGAQVLHRVENYVPSIRTAVSLPQGQQVHFYGEHPKPPIMHSTRRGDTELIRAGRQIESKTAPAILAGDLNDVPWSYTSQTFKRVSGMVDPRIGRGFLASYKTGNPILRWPLDHIFTTRSIATIQIKRLPDVGSDHFPILADLCIGQSGSATSAS